MDQTTQTTETQGSQSPFPAQPSPSSGNVGPLIAAVVIVLMLAAGGFYFFYTQQHKAMEGAEPEQAAPAGDTTSTQSIEADLNATETGGGQGDVDNLNQAL